MHHQAYVYCCACGLYLLHCRELREGARRACEQRQSLNAQDAATEAVNSARLAATRKHALAMQRHEHDAKQQQYDSDLQAAVEQADKASARLLTQRQTKAAAQRQHEQQRRQQYNESAYKPSSGSSATGIQARLQALVMGADCSP